MSSLKTRWKRVPDKLRRTLVLILGVLLILLSGLIGWLPGPGGLVPFLLGIAVLASEFEWAERVRDTILDYVHKVGHYLRTHPRARALFVIASIFGAILIAYVFYSYVI